MMHFDTIIIGAGPGGYELAALLANKGEQVAIVERAELGGTCLNRGCIPIKCLCATAQMAMEARRATIFGVETGAISVDYPRAAARMLSVVEGLRQGVSAELSQCTVIHGTGKLVDNRHIDVDGEIYESSRIVIATGSRPAIIPIPGSELCVSSDNVLAMDRLPSSAVIIGGGVIGIEFASIFNALGVKTDVVELADEILPPFDKDTAKRLRMALKRRGISFNLGCKVKSVEKLDNGQLHVSFVNKKGEAAIDADMAVMAVGRRPVLPEGLTDVGINLNERGYIAVDSCMRTNVDGIYAVGDVNGISMLAHSAISQGHVVAFDNPSLFNPLCVPSVVFSMPEVAMVGHTPSSLEEAGIAYRTIRKSFAANGKACAIGAPEGALKMLVAEEDESILGISIIGDHASDLIAEATILVTERRCASEIATRYIHAHPTLSEIFV